MKSGKVLLGVLGGVAAGALLGILFAPEKGTRTRRKIMDKSEDYAEGLKDSFNGFLDNITKKYENVWHEAETLVSDGKAKYAEVLSDGKAKYDDTKKEMRNQNL